MCSVGLYSCYSKSEKWFKQGIMFQLLSQNVCAVFKCLNAIWDSEYAYNGVAIPSNLSQETIREAKLECFTL